MNDIEKLQSMIEDENKLRILAKRYLATGEFERLEREHGLEEGTFDVLFGESKDLEMVFQQAILEEAENKRTMKAAYQVGKSIDRLFNITEDPEEDPKLVNQAAAIILNYYSKRESQKSRAKEDDDDLFNDLFDRVRKERNGK
jgi:hypothetical protein